MHGEFGRWGGGEGRVSVSITLLQTEALIHTQPQQTDFMHPLRAPKSDRLSTILRMPLKATFFPTILCVTLKATGYESDARVCQLNRIIQTGTIIGLSLNLFFVLCFIPGREGEVRMV